MGFCKRLLRLLAALVARRPETIFSMLKGGLYYVDSRSCVFQLCPDEGIGMLFL
jgi:hypothetical protein